MKCSNDDLFSDKKHVSTQQATHSKASKSSSISTSNPQPPALTHQSSSLNPNWLKTALGIWLIPIVLAAKPAVAAEKIYISYGVLERSISIQSLETYAREGTIEDDLLAYTEYATPEQLEQLRTLLLTRADVSPTTVSQFLYTDQGEVLLERLGQVVQTESRQSGFYAIRSALILAAADPDGLTPLNVLRKFPVYGLRIDVERTLQIVQQLERLINQTNGATAAVERQSAIEAASEPLANSSGLSELWFPGNYFSQIETITLTDDSRDRTFVADIYLPTTTSGSPLATPAPVIVISHGLGSDRTTYIYLARHLASYGFVVAVPEHPGSNSDQLQALVEGRANEVTEPAEFVNRPLDIKFLLDELEERSRFDPALRGRLDLQQVGVLGQSFGGYTALALAGAEINFPQLTKDCGPNDSFNLSLLLQCRALSLAQPTADLRDSRVKAIIAINPIGSSILGEEGFSKVNLPVMMISGNADTVAPSLIEQIRPFTWLNTSSKYLLLMRGATHFSTLGEPAPDRPVVDLPAEILGPDRAAARRYLSAMSVAFFETYVANKPAYRDYLGAAYARSISQNTLPLRLVRFLTPNQLVQSLSDRFVKTNSVEPPSRFQAPEFSHRYNSNTPDHKS